MLKNIGSFALYRGVIIASLSSLANTPCSNDKLTRFVRGTEIDSFINLIFLDDIPSRPGAPSLRQLITFFISNSFVGFKNSEGSMLSGKNCLCERLF